MGVKSLWKLLEPAAKPRRLETLAGQKLAIDASIWLHQFLKAMRDKEGNLLKGAHIVGFYRRICKLLYFGIRPVFVFDGDTPAMKRVALTERRRRKTTAKSNLARTAHKILYKRLQLQAIQKSKAHETASAPAALESTLLRSDALQELPQDVRYVDQTEDAHVTPPAPIPQSNNPRSSNRKGKRDEYELPEEVEEVSTAAFVDHRFVTEEEMRDFINNHKNDVDLSSVDLDAQAFKDLPIETQHDIVTELKNRSRQADQRRLAGLVNAAPNPIAFSALQIKHLVKRNDLTERLQNLAKNAGVTSNPGLKKWKVKHARRPQRVASERAREYMLVKNTETGGHTIKLNAKLQRGGAGGFQNDPSIAPPVIDLVDEDCEMSEETSDEEIEPDVDARIASVRRLPAKKQSKRIIAKHHHTTPATEVDSDDDEEFDEITDIPTPPYTASAVSGMEQGTHGDMVTYTSHGADEENSLLANFRAYLPDNLPIEKVMEYFATGPPEGPTEDGPSTDMYEDEPPETGWGGHRSSSVPAWPDTGLSPESYVGRREAATEGRWDAQPAIEPSWTGENTWEENKSGSWGKDVALGWSTEVEKEVTTRQLEEKHSWTKSVNENDQEDAFVVQDEARQMGADEENADGWARSPLRTTPDLLDNALVTYPEVSIEEQKLLTYGELGMNETVQHRDGSNTRLNNAVLKVLTGAITPDEAYRAWQDILTDAFTSVYPDHENMLRLAVYGWSEEELQEEQTHVKKRHDKAVEGSISAQAHELWIKILEYTLIWREERRSKNETVTVAPADAAGLEGHSPIEEKVVIVADPDYAPPHDRAPTTDIQLPLAASKLLPPLSPEPIITDRIGFLARTSPMKRTLTGNVGNVIKSPKRSSADVLGFASDSEDEEFHSPAIKKHKRPDIVEGIMEAEVEMTGVTSGLLAATKQAHVTAPVTPPRTKPIVEHVNTPPSEEQPSRVSTTTETASVKPVIEPSPTPAQAAIDLDGPDLFEEDVYLNDEDEEMAIDVPTELNEENEEYARFVSSLSNQTPDDVARRLENEMISLNKQKRKEEASAVDIETQLIREIQELLRIFGLPYIAAPMEAESQCAWLVQNSLVDGIVTDDSDVFLFGGTMIYKNMFNQQKYVEEYTMNRLEETMLLTREKLVQLAYLLGSDYTEGIEGIGPTSAMEILNMWRGEGLEPLQGFRVWWEGVLRGETEVDEDPILRRLRKHCQKLAIPSSFPDPRVLDAYFHPQLDTNPTAFIWGRPDLNALRDFMEDKLDWKQHQVDQLMIPLIKEMDRNLNEKNRQARLDKFFSVTSTNVHASERVREVVDGWKEGGGKRRKVESKRGRKTVSKKGRGRGRK
ncbi:hypothetical protein SpCBS45565_g02268 [Spizellomyces sp. 'palustris']|nr:hypothetical protein SpCBS45565_g02268 [Spizellomyces sp. 'palustris']